jgi:hypothetical protein
VLGVGGSGTVFILVVSFGLRIFKFCQKKVIFKMLPPKVDSIFRVSVAE